MIFEIQTDFKNIIVCGYSNLYDMIQRLKRNGYTIIKIVRY